MPKTRIRSVEKDMPHARLYLDDLREIEGIVRQVVAPRDAIFSYSIRDYRFDGIDDLHEHSGFTPDLQVSVKLCKTDPNEPGDYIYSGFSSILRFYSSAAVVDPPYYLESQEKWVLIGQIRDVFKSRNRPFKSALHALPLLPLLLFVGVGYGFGFSLFVDLGETIVRHQWHVSRIAIDSIVFVAALILTLGYWSRDGVYLRYARQTELERERTWKERSEKLIFLLLGSVIGIGGAIATAWLTGHLK